MERDMPMTNGFDGMPIKPEPTDDQDVVMTNAMFVPQGPKEVQAAAASSRAMDRDGNPCETVCFDFIYRTHPYQHKLFCNHVVMTDIIEPCGSNCQISRYASSKPTGRPFECPFPECVRKRKVLVSTKNSRTGKKATGRLCIPSHIHGLDRAADDARNQEKEGHAQRGRRGLRAEDRTLLRKTSVSPPRRAKQTRASARATSMHPDQISATDNDTTMTGTENAITQTPRSGKTREMRKLAIDMENPFKPRTAAKTVIAPTVVKAKADFRDHEHHGLCCDGCDGIIIKTRFHCEDCPDGKGQLGFDLCKTCYEKRKEMVFPHRVHKADHKFSAITKYDPTKSVLADQQGPVKDHDVDYEQKELWCICNTEINDNMMECEGCHKAFHPNCVGEGFHADTQYSQENAEDFHKMDVEKFRALVNRSFLCLNCKTGETRAANDTQQAEDDLRLAREMVAKAMPNTGKSKKRSVETFEADFECGLGEEDETDEARMRSLFGEDEQEAPAARMAKCAKTGTELPTFGQMTLAIHKKH